MTGLIAGLVFIGVLTLILGIRSGDPLGFFAYTLGSAGCFAAVTVLLLRFG